MAMDIKTARAERPNDRSRSIPADGGEAAPRTAMEQGVAAIWQEVLAREGISRTDDFFDLGGTSLDLIRVFARVNKQFGLSLNGSALEDEATIARMASCIESAVRARK
jgi:acyl carrier protein